MSGADRPTPASTPVESLANAETEPSTPQKDTRVQEPVSGYGPDQPGTVIGSYRLLRLLGRGGMGTVWLAERHDGQFRKHVALKLVNAGVDQADLRARFLQERQILANLQHPNIAALFDGGVVADGRPFFALEFVDGRSINEFCDEEKLGVRERVRLFLQVLRAVSHAHQRLIVHRDLKPSNVLVTREKVVKLLDFGIAKLLQHPSEAGPMTQIGDRAMTPRYAAPEQIRGDPITVSTDVYALGVALFELLTGRTPYPLRSWRPRDVEEAILHTEPQKPAHSLNQASTELDLAPARERFERGIDLVRLGRELAGDLELILLKAMRKDPQQRYASVEAFGADLERFLDGRPIEARAPSLGYRLRKWLRRHALAAGTGTLVFLLLIAALFAVLVERDRAREAAARAEATQDFLVGLFEEAGPDQGGNADLSVRDILARGAARVERDLGSTQLLQHRLHGLIGRLMSDVGDYSRAEPVLRQALRGYESAAESDPAKLQVRLDLAAALQGANRFEEAERELAIVIAQAPADSELAAQAHLGLGSSYGQTSKLAQAIAEYESGVLSLRALGLGQHRALASALIGQAFVLDSNDQADAAIAALNESIAILRVVNPPLPAVLGRALYQLGMSELTLGDRRAAHDHLQESVALLSKSLGADHRTTLVARRLLADVLEELGESAAARDLLEQVRSDARARYGADDLLTAEISNSLATLDLRDGDYAAAEGGFRAVLRTFEQAYGAQHADTAVATANLANALFEQGRFDEAIATQQRSLEITAASAGAESSEHALSLFALGRFQRYAGDDAAAARAFERAEASFSALYDESHPQLLRVRQARAGLLLDGGGDPAEVLGIINNLLRRINLDARQGRRLRAELLSLQARCLLLQKDPDAAAEALKEALEIGSSEYAGGHRLVAEIALELAELHRLAGRSMAAKSMLARADAANPHRQPLSPRALTLRKRLQSL